MFFKNKTNRRKTTRQTLSTEQLEPKAMFNAVPLQANIGFEDRLSDDYDTNDAVFQISSSQSITCNNGFSGGGAYTCGADSIWTNGGASTLRIGANSGPGGTTFMTSEDGRIIVHPQYNVGEDSHSIVHPQYNVGEDGRMIIHPQFNVGEDGHMIIHPQFNVGEDGRMIIHPQFNVGEDGRMIIHPQFNVGEDGRMIVHPQYAVGEEGRSIVHPQYNLGEDAVPAGTIIPHKDSHLSAKDLIGQPPEPKIAPPSPHVSDRVAVIDDSNDRIEEVVRTSSAPRLEVFARMGR